MATPQNINDGLYNALCQGLGLSGQSFTIIQPNPPLLPNDDFLWNYFNYMPVLNLNQDILSGGNQFFDDYKGLFSALKSVVGDRFEQDVGQDVRDQFFDYIQKRTPPPALSQYPAIFRSWAFLRHPNVANKGASDLAAALLDPIASGQLAIVGYTGDPGADPPIPARRPDWDQGYNELIQELSMAPRRSFIFDQTTINTDVTNTWAHGSHSGFFGLWRGSSNSSSQTKIFAENTFKVTASFGHVLPFTATPGPWYSSAATGLAYSHKTGAPWDPASPINWTTTFDPQQGNMRLFMANLVVVDTLHIEVTSGAVWSIDDQTVIQNNSGSGLWPFYVGNNSNGASQTANFDKNGLMTMKTDSLPGVPIILGGNVLAVDQYLGHAVAGRELFGELLQENRAFREVYAIR